MMSLLLEGMTHLFPLFGPGSSDRSYKRNRHNQNVSLSETHIFSSTVFNEFRAGWNRSLTFEELETSFKTDVGAQLGIGDQLPLTRNPLEWGPPNFNIGQSSSALGLPGLRTGAPWNPNGGQIWQYADNLSIIKGKHSLKAGATVMRRNNVFIETLTARGSFNFGGTGFRESFHAHSIGGFARVIAPKIRLANRFASL